LPEDILCSVTPKTGNLIYFFDPSYSKILIPIFHNDIFLGRVIVFNHDTRHEGEVVKGGIKYIIRTEIVFKRSGEHPNPKYKEDPQYRKVISIYIY
jgi:hypothetical protein